MNIKEILKLRWVKVWGVAVLFALITDSIYIGSLKMYYYRHYGFNFKAIALVSLFAFLSGSIPIISFIILRNLKFTFLKKSLILLGTVFVNSYVLASYMKDIAIYHVSVNTWSPIYAITTGVKLYASVDFWLIFYLLLISMMLILALKIESYLKILVLNMISGILVYLLFYALLKNGISSDRLHTNIVLGVKYYLFVITAKVFLYKYLESKYIKRYLVR